MLWMLSISGRTPYLAIERSFNLWSISFWSQSLQYLILISLLHRSCVPLFEIITLSTSLPKYESSHEFEKKEKASIAAAACRKLQAPKAATPAVAFSPPTDSAIWLCTCSSATRCKPATAWSANSGYWSIWSSLCKPPGPSAGPGRYSPGGNPSGGYNHPNSGQGGGGPGRGHILLKAPMVLVACLVLVLEEGGSGYDLEALITLMVVHTGFWSWTWLKHDVWESQPTIQLAAII